MAGITKSLDTWTKSYVQKSNLAPDFFLEGPLLVE
jgi:hypothetical protein